MRHRTPARLQANDANHGSAAARCAGSGRVGFTLPAPNTRLSMGLGSAAKAPSARTCRFLAVVPTGPPFPSQTQASSVPGDSERQIACPGPARPN